MTKKLLPLFILFALILTACGNAGEQTATTDEGKKTEEKTEEKTENKTSEFSLKLDGKEQNFSPSSSWATHWEKTFSYPVDGETKTDKASHTEIILANYELDTKDGKYGLAKQKIEKPEQIKVEFAFNGEKDTDSETPIKVGKYEINPGDYFEASKMMGKIDDVEVFHFVDGKEKETSFMGNKMKGTLKITEVNDNTIKGTIDVTDGKHSIKGSFIAKGDNTVK